MKNLKKLSREELKSVKGGNPKPVGPGGTCQSGWRDCYSCQGDYWCVSPSQEHLFCAGYMGSTCN